MFGMGHSMSSEDEAVHGGLPPVPHDLPANGGQALPGEGRQAHRAAHMRLVLDCGEICQMAMNFHGSQLRPPRRRVSRLRRDMPRCAASCEELGDKQECVDACLRSAETATRWLPWLPEGLRRQGSGLGSVLFPPPLTHFATKLRGGVYLRVMDAAGAGEGK